MKTRTLLLLAISALIVIASAASAHEPVKLSGYLVDVSCAADHVKDPAPDATKFASEHTKDCGLMDECVKSGYGIFSEGKWYPFDEKGNKLAKAVFDKTKKKDHIKVLVEGNKHNDKILVEKITEEK